MTTRPASKVKYAAADNVKAMNIIKEVADALTQSCNHYKTTKVASKAALEAERQFEIKEAKRLERKRLEDQKKAAKKAEKEKEAMERREQKKMQKQERKEKEKADAAAAAPVEDGGDHPEADANGRSSRRGKGLSELADSDPSVLKDKIPSRDALIVTSNANGEFVSNICTDEPVILRLNRSVHKKVLEMHACVSDANHKEIVAINNSLKAEVEAYIGVFAEKVEAGLGCWAGLGWAGA